MKLIQLNCWGGKLGTALVRFMGSENPDFVCLQEAFLMETRPGSVVVSPEYFLPKDKWPNHNNAPVFGMNYMRGNYDLSNCVVSKLGPTEETMVYTNGEYNSNLDSLVDDYNIRNFAHSTFEIEGKKLNIISHHGYHHPDHKDGSEENTKALQIVADYIKNLEGETIFTGDLNLHPESESLTPVENILQNLCKEYSVKATRNQLAKRPDEIIDYVYVSKGVKVKKFEASDALVSDHRALILEFDL